MNQQSQEYHIADMVTQEDTCRAKTGVETQDQKQENKSFFTQRNQVDYENFPKTVSKTFTNKIKIGKQQLPEIIGQGLDDSTVVKADVRITYKNATKFIQQRKRVSHQTAAKQHSTSYQGQAAHNSRSFLAKSPQISTARLSYNSQKDWNRDQFVPRFMKKDRNSDKIIISGKGRISSRLSERKDSVKNYFASPYMIPCKEFISMTAQKQREALISRSPAGKLNKQSKKETSTRTITNAAFPRNDLVKTQIKNPSRQSKETKFYQQFNHNMVHYVNTVLKKQFHKSKVRKTMSSLKKKLTSQQEQLEQLRDSEKDKNLMHNSYSFVNQLVDGFEEDGIVAEINNDGEQQFQDDSIQKKFQDSEEEVTVTDKLVLDFSVNRQAMNSQHQEQHITTDLIQSHMKLKRAPPKEPLITKKIRITPSVSKLNLSVLKNKEKMEKLDNNRSKRSLRLKTFVNQNAQPKQKQIINEIISQEYVTRNHTDTVADESQVGTGLPTEQEQLSMIEKDRARIAVLEQCIEEMKEKAKQEKNAKLRLEKDYQEQEQKMLIMQNQQEAKVGIKQVEGENNNLVAATTADQKQQSSLNDSLTFAKSTDKDSKRNIDLCSASSNRNNKKNEVASMAKRERAYTTMSKKLTKEPSEIILQYSENSQKAAAAAQIPNEIFKDEDHPRVCHIQIGKLLEDVEEPPSGDEEIQKNDYDNNDPAADVQNNKVSTMEQSFEPASHQQQQIINMHGFEQFAYRQVKASDVLGILSSVFNANQFVIRNRCKVRQVNTSILSLGENNHSQIQVHESWKDIAIEVIEHKQFYQVLEKELIMFKLSVFQREELDDLLIQIGAINYANITRLDNAKVIRLAILHAALQVHDYQYSALSIRDQDEQIDYKILDVKSMRIMNRLASKVQSSHQVYLQRLNQDQIEIIKRRHVDVISIVLLALFDEYIGYKTEDKKMKIPLLQPENFYAKLVTFNVRKSGSDVPNLTSFLAYKNQTTYIDVKRLATATGEFLKSSYLQSFGTTKNKSADQSVESIQSPQQQTQQKWPQQAYAQGVNKKLASMIIQPPKTK